MVISPAEGEFTAIEGDVQGLAEKPETLLKVVNVGIATPVKLTVMVDVAVNALEAVKPMSHKSATPAAVVVGTKVTPVTAAEALASKPTTDTADPTSARPNHTVRTLRNNFINNRPSTF
jgi:hypothetical protein